MPKVINIGVPPEHIERRARILENVGYEVENAYCMTDLQQLLEAGGDVLVIGHNLPGSEKRHVFEIAKSSHGTCQIVEVYMYVPELMSATAHVCWDEGSDALIGAVNRAMSVPFK